MLRLRFWIHFLGIVAYILKRSNFQVSTDMLGGGNAKKTRSNLESYHKTAPNYININENKSTTDELVPRNFRSNIYNTTYSSRVRLSSQQN
ncbi:hypothetical protein AAHE18_16G100900 [Arachis hypogaea]